MRSKGFVFFCSVLLLLAGYYTVHNAGVEINALSSDVWSYQMMEIQSRLHVWSDIPPSYNQSEWYIAFPLFYLLNPGLEGSLVPYHALAVFLIVLIYTINGAVIYKIFKTWWLAAVVPALLIIPRYVFPTRIGLLSLEQLRANVLVFPFYLLLTYYWILYGISDRRKNIALGILSGLCIYLYPPTAITTALFGVIAAFLVHGKKHLREIILFGSVFVAVALPFAFNHWQNENTTMIETAPLSTEERAIQLEAIQRAFAGNITMTSVEFEEMKRIVWDQAPMLMAFFLSLFLVWRYRDRLHPDIVTTTRISAYLFILTWGFVLSIEAANWYMVRGGNLPIFIEHLRILRGIGFITAVQLGVCLYIVATLWRQWIAVLIAVAILLTPIYFFAPILRGIVRVVVPEEIRARYNLAPVVAPEEQKEFQLLEEAARWARASLPEDSKIFVFKDLQREFQFKVLSRHDTSSTEKEGNLWVTTGFDNTEKWISERKRYDEATGSGSFFEIVAFARETGSTHMLLPRGEYSELFDSSDMNVRVVFENADYRILEL